MTRIEGPLRPAAASHAEPGTAVALARAGFEAVRSRVDLADSHRRGRCAIARYGFQVHCPATLERDRGEHGRIRVTESYQVIVDRSPLFSLRNRPGTWQLLARQPLVDHPAPVECSVETRTHSPSP